MKQQKMYFKTTLHLIELRSLNSNCTQIFTNANPTASTNHKSTYTASFYARKPESFTANIYARNTLGFLEKLKWKWSSGQRIWLGNERFEFDVY